MSERNVVAAVFNQQCICCLICSAYQNEADINSRGTVEEQTAGFSLVINVSQTEYYRNVQGNRQIPMARLHAVNFETVTRQMGQNQESRDERIHFLWLYLIKE